MPSASATAFITHDGREVSLKGQSIALRMNRSATMDRSSKRVRPGAAGRMTLNNLDERWTPGRSSIYSDAFLVAPIPIRVELRGETWFRGELLLEHGDRGDTVRGRISSRLTQAYQQSNVRVQGAAGDDLAAVMSKVGGALGITVRLRARPEEAALPVGPFDVTRNGAQWLLAICEAIPSLAYEDVDGALEIRTLRDLQTDPRQVLSLSDRRHWISDELDIGPDARRVVNRYEITNLAGDVAAYEDLVSQQTWRPRPLVSDFKVWAAAPARDVWAAGLAEFGQPPIVTRIRLPLTQPTDTALDSILGARAGTAASVTGEDVSISRVLLVGLTLEARRGALDVLELSGLSTTFTAVPFRVGRMFRPLYRKHWTLGDSDRSHLRAAGSSRTPETVLRSETGQRSGQETPRVGGNAVAFRETVPVHQRAWIINRSHLRAAGSALPPETILRRA